MDSLSPEHREQLRPILVAMQANRKGAAVPLLEHTPGVVIEGESTDVTPDPLPPGDRQAVKVYKREKFDTKNSLKEYRAAIEGDGDTLAQIEAMEAEQRD